MATIKESFNTYWKSFQEQFNSLPSEKKKEVGTIVLAMGEDGLQVGISGSSDIIEYLVARLLDCDAIKKETLSAAMCVALGVFDTEKKDKYKHCNPTDLFNEIVGEEEK